MKIFVLAAAVIATLSTVNAAEQSSIHLRVHQKGGSCTITNESQCNGQNWTGSTCCADSNYECRWSDDGQNVQRCQKKKRSGNTGNTGNTGGSCTITNESQCNGQNWTGSTCCADPSYECRWSDDGQNVQRCQKKWHHHHHKAAKDAADEDDDVTLDDIAEAVGLDASDYDSFSDFDDFSDYFDDDSSADDDEDSSDSSDVDDETRHKKELQKGGSCTITNESQCDGQNWTGSTCCADSKYECRWSDDGQNVKRCQKKKW